MSNGVEVIVATDRGTRIGEPEFLRLLSSTVTRPITLAPHTLTNHMSMVLPTDYINEAENELVSSLHTANSFVTKTYHTTYTYLTTVITDGSEEISAKKTVISNVKTEEAPHGVKGSDKLTSTAQVSLEASPTMETHVFHTTLTYMNTILDGDQPLVLTSKHVLSNTVVGAEEYLTQLEPSEIYPTTNTYLKTVEFTKTLTDGTDYQVISTKDVLTQVVVADKPEKQTMDKPLTTDVTKTYFVTYTYFSTYLDGGETKVKSDVSVSSDITIEKFYVKPKKTDTKSIEKNTRIETQNEITSMPFSIFATKTYLTTFTYFTTLLQGGSDKTETKINTRTRVVQNVVTEAVNAQDLNSEYFNDLKSSFDNKIDSPIVTTAILKGGEKLEITALKGDPSDIVYEKFKIKPTKSTLNTKTEDFNDIEAAENNLELLKTKYNAKPTPQLSKTKTTIYNKQKSKPIKTIYNQITAEALIGLKDEEMQTVTSASTHFGPASTYHIDASESKSPSYSTSVLTAPTKTTSQETLMSGAQVPSIRDENEQNTVKPISVPVKKEELQTQQLVKSPNNTQANDILKLGPLNINGMNVLGPVFNAMAELINNNLNAKPKDVISKRNDTVSTKKNPSNINQTPLKSPATADAKSKSTTARTPVYIPVGSFAEDSDFGESQDNLRVAEKNPWHEKWVDMQPKNFEKKRPHDPAITILESGIPISPGQIITTNSDVIIGRPGALGPRPPNFALKNSVPIDMKPPPLPPADYEEEDAIGQHSTNQGVDPDLRKEEDIDMVPPPPPIIKPHVHPQTHVRPQPHKHVAPHVHLHYKPPQKQKHDPRDDGTIDLNPPPVPPPIRPQLEIRPITINHQPHEIIPYKPNQIEGNIIPIPVHLGPNENVDDYVNPAEIRPDALGLPSIPIFDTVKKDQNPSREPTPNIHHVNPNGIRVAPNEPATVSQNQHVIDRSTGHPLLVNVRPSQVTNVVIPHGSSTALIIAGQKEHSLKGSVIDDPSPHPEPETVGLFGAEPVLKIESGDVTSANQNEVLPGLPETNAKEKRPNNMHLRSKPDYNNIGMKPPQYSPQSFPPQQQYPPYNHQPHPSQSYQLPPQPINDPHFPNDAVKLSNGMYGDVPSQEPNYGIDYNENPGNHQLVHNIPLNVKVQLGYPPNGDQLNNNNNYINQTHGDINYHEGTNYIKRPGDLIPENMSPPPPPPPPKATQIRPVRPFQSSGNQRYPTHSQALKPLDFMVPPPQVSHRPNYQPHPEKNSRPVLIPVGAGAENEYPSPRPEDILIVPLNIHNQYQIYPTNQGLDAGDSNDPLKTEDGEEIQESNSRPLLPGQLPTELEKIKRTQSSDRDKNNFKIENDQQSANSNNDKTDIIDPNSVAKESTKEQTSKPEIGQANATTLRGDSKTDSELNVNEAEQLFGSKLNGENNKPVRKPPNGKYEESKIHSTASEINNILTPPKIPEKEIDSKKSPEEVMGLSPPPFERPKRPVRPQRPKPPYKFEVPTTPKTTHTPITIENDFPPVRSPEYTRKPLKPQDKFPPRLPDDFVHHVDFPPVRTPKPRPESKYPVKDRPTVTSLPIDVPGSSTTEKPKQRPAEFLLNDSVPNISLAEINGHSKPVAAKEEPLFGSMRPPPPPPPPLPTQNRPKPIINQRPPTTHLKRPIHESKRPISQNVRDQIRPSSIREQVFKTTYQLSPQSVSATKHKNWKEGDIIVGSETIFDTERFNKLHTPVVQGSTERKNIVTSLITTGSTTIFGDVFTVPIQLDPTRTKSAKDEPKKTVNFQAREKPEKHTTTKEIPAVTHTTTLTVTTTMTTVVHSIGQKPSTKTVVLTKTLISTIVDKVTEYQTLVKPTTATITQTHTIQTTKTALVVPTVGYPKYPTGITLKPEIFIEDPHDKDTMTISVSSSMNKDKRKGIQKQDPDNVVDQSENESILVVMTDKNPKFNFSGHRNRYKVGEEDSKDEPNILLGGVLLPGSTKDYKDIIRQNECLPECKATRNELCQKHEGTMKCVCRPGFARMFLDRPCKPTYTYNMKLTLEKLGGDSIGYGKDLNQAGSAKFTKLASATKEGLDRMIMQSDLRDVYHGVIVNGFQPKKKKTMVDFHVQLSENTEESRLMDVFKKTLRTSNFSLGGTELFAAREADNLEAQDFNECSNTKFHDCSENARCFNLKGTYTCSCKEGFTDLSENTAFPGRLCSDMIGCEYCGYHGTCYTRGDDQITCECFQWYSGDRCRINLKVLLIALVTIGAILLALLLVCIVLTCLKRRSRSTNTSRANGSSGYLRYRGPPSQAMDKRAMIADSSSESSVENLPYINSPPPPPPPSGTMSAKRKPVLKQHNKGPAPRPMEPPVMVPVDQRDRSVTVMIPRAKYRPIPPISPHLTMSTFSPDKHLSRTAAQISTEQKLINYLEGNAREATLNQQNRLQKEQKIYDCKASNSNMNDGPRSLEYKKEHRVFEYEYKTSNMNITDGNSSGDRRSSKHGDSMGRFRRHSDSTNLNNDHVNRSLQHRKYSTGALVSAGFEVSATVGLRNLEDDLTEEDNFAILNIGTMKSNRSQFTTLNRTGDHKTMSEARSYDETTIHPPTRSLKTHYSGSSHSRVNNEEGHTMVERDLGSTFLMPESHLFKPDRDRGSDISNFDSL